MHWNDLLEHWMWEKVILLLFFRPYLIGTYWEFNIATHSTCFFALSNTQLITVLGLFLLFLTYRWLLLSLLIGLLPSLSVLNTATYLPQHPPCYREVPLWESVDTAQVFSPWRVNEWMEDVNMSSWVSPEIYVEALTPSNCECDLIWK